MNKKNPVIVMFLIIFTLLCKGEAPAPKVDLDNKGVGEIKSVALGQIDPALAKSGEALFTSKCIVCHQMGKRHIGPDLTGITKIRSPEWTMNMILNPEEMTKKDPVAIDLLKEYVTQMTFQNLTEAEARSILEYFREFDSRK